MKVGRLLPLLAAGLLSVLAACATLPFGGDDDTDVTVYGAAGTFGDLLDTTPTGQSLETQAQPGWLMDGGLMPFFTAVTSDGTVFVANMQQTLNQFFVSSCSMAITCFNPDEETCYDAESAAAAHFSTIRIPTGAGDLYNPPDGESTCEELTRGLGSDVSDIEVVIDPELGERVVFVSFIGSIVVGLDSFPAFGAIELTPDGWALDPTSLRTSYELQSASPEGEVGCANLARPCFFQTDCPGGACVEGRCDIECTADRECVFGQSCRDGQCGKPSCGLNEHTRLPHSGHLATAHYTPPKVSVMDSTGAFMAVHLLPAWPDPCHPGQDVVLSPREVVADPTSVPGDERFVVVYDSLFERGYPVQEFSYDAAAHALTPTSAPFVPWSPIDGPTECGAAPRRGSHPVYDDRGNLWIDTNHGLGVGALHIFQTNPDTGRRSYEENCFLDSESGQMYPVGHPCRSDLDLGVATLAGQTPTSWGCPWGSSLLYDEISQSVIFGGVGARIGFVQGTNLDDTFYATEFVILGAQELPDPADGESRFSAKGVLDGGRRALWKPHGTTAVTGPEGCDFFNCTWQMGDLKEFWLFRLSIDPVRRRALQVLEVVEPPGIEQGSPFSIELVVNLPGGLSDVDTSASALALYLDDATAPDALVAWQEGGCTGEGCVFEANVGAKLTSGSPGRLFWHGIFTTTDAPPRTLHVAGKLQVTP